MCVMGAGQFVAEQVLDGDSAKLDALDDQLLDQRVGQARKRGVKLAGEGKRRLGGWWCGSILVPPRLVTTRVGRQRPTGQGKKRP